MVPEPLITMLPVVPPSYAPPEKLIGPFKLRFVPT